MSDLIDLPREQVHIWIAAVQDWVETSAFQDLLDTLNSEERNRASRFAFDRDREVYTLGTRHASTSSFSLRGDRPSRLDL